jgi:Acetyltransferase (GNAT) domain
MIPKTIEISVKGKRQMVPAWEINGKNIIINGKYIRIAEIHAEEWLETELQNPEEYVREITSRRPGGPRADILTFAQKLPATEPKYSYPYEWESIAAVRTMSFEEWWNALPQETRKNVRRSQKRGVVTMVKALDDDLVRSIVDVNNDSPIRQGRSFDHYGKNFDQVKRDQSSFLDRSDFICAYVGEELIGFLKLVYSGNTASILQILPKASHADKKPANALIAKAVEVCQDKGIAYLIYGRYNYTNKGDSSLRQFKVRNGFTEILVPRFHVPLTRWGRCSMKLNLHHGFRGILPPGVLAFLVSIRARWYKILLGRRSSTPERSNRNRQTERSTPPAGSTIADPRMTSSE